MRSFDLLLRIVMKRTGLPLSQARELLYALADTITRQALMRGRRVVWPRLGTFRGRASPSQTLSLVALKATGHLPPEAPDSAFVPSSKRLVFRPSRSHSVLRGAR